MHRVIPNMRALAGIAVVAAIAFAAHGHRALAQDAAGDKVIANVDGKPITEADMKLAEGEIGAELANLPPEVKRRALAEYLIDNQLFANAAEAAKLGDTPEFQTHHGLPAPARAARAVFREDPEGQRQRGRGQEDLQRTRRRAEARGRVRGPPHPRRQRGEGEGVCAPRSSPAPTSSRSPRRIPAIPAPRSRAVFSATSARARWCPNSRRPSPRCRRARCRSR